MTDIFSADETAKVSGDYDGESSVFTGTVEWVQIGLGEDAEDADHLIARGAPAGRDGAPVAKHPAGRGKEER